MQIERETVAEMTLEQFADAHGLVMKVVERPLPVGDSGRYYAEFKGVEIKEGCILKSCYGNGATEAQAIKEHGERISLQRIVVNAYRPDRREIQVPRIVKGAE